MKATSILVSLVLVLGTALSALGDERTWISNSDGNWTDSSNWSSSIVPGVGNNDGALVAWSGAGSGSITLDTDLSANAIGLLRGGHDSGGFNITITITANGKLSVSGDFCPAYGQHQVLNMAGTVSCNTFESQAVANLTANLTGSSLIEITHTGETTGGAINGGAFYMQTGDVITLSDTAMIQWQGDHLNYVNTNYIGDEIVAGSGFTLNVNTTDRSGWTTIKAVPEPATVAILGLGSLVLLRRRR
jgi:hypothetical protein